MMTFIDYRKLSIYENDKTKQGIYITCDKSKTWYVLFKMRTDPIIKQFDDIVDATKFIVETKKDLAVKKAFNRSMVFDI